MRRLKLRFVGATIVFVSVYILISNIQAIQLPPCNTLGPKNAIRCKIPIIITLCKETDEQFSVTNPNKKLKYNFKRQVFQTVALIKSLAITQREFKNDYGQNNIILEITVFGNDYSAFQFLLEEVDSWNNEYRTLFVIIWRSAEYAESFEWSRALFAPCTTLRLQFPFLLDKEDAIVYLDTDLLLMEPIYSLWNQFSKQNESSLSMAQESQLHLRSELSSIFGSKRIKSYNAGVMLMNLTKLRSNSNWYNWLNKAKAYQKQLTYADQDILNLYIGMYPDEMSEFPCNWNFLAYYVDPKWHWFCNTDLSNSSGVSVLHGTSRLFFNPGRFQAIFQNYLKADLSQPGITSKQLFEGVASIEYCGLQNYSVVCNNEYFNKSFS